MEILHVSAECYPVAKAGGLGDVVGALPKYQQQSGHVAKVVMPMYRTKFLYQSDWELVHEGRFAFDNTEFRFAVIKERNNKLGFDLYLVDINGLLDRDTIYGYDDDAQRFIAFQTAVLHWLNAWNHQPDIIHVHDHHAGLIPFMMRHCGVFDKLQHIPTVFTIHNGEYQGTMDWDFARFLPGFDTWKWGLLDWKGNINPMASAVRCAWRVTTVSPTYMRDLLQNSQGLEALFQEEKNKCSGILNGIDNLVWNPQTDQYLPFHFNANTVTAGKAQNKALLCEQFGLDPSVPLISFIGRLVHEKAADLLPQAIGDALHFQGRKMCFFVLGSGEAHVAYHLEQLHKHWAGYFANYIGYNEALSHMLYAASDFILMPSRVEPCGLNQLYALRYGTMPIVRNTGGLHDTVVDIGEVEGYGLKFDQASVWDITYSIHRAVQFFTHQPADFSQAQERMMQLDFSWENSTQQYLSLYQSIQP